MYGREGGGRVSVGVWEREGEGVVGVWERGREGDGHQVFVEVVEAGGEGLEFDAVQRYWAC